MADRSGETLASKYRLEKLLGSGAMGHVYRATNVRAGRAVAIKILRTEHVDNAPIVERFLREAMAANLVRHPNVVDVLDVDKDESGAPFIVQELLAGEDLSHYVARVGAKLSLREVEELVLPVIDALAEAHARGVVHRDIKPENVFLSLQGERRVPKLLDFGISKVRAPGVKATEVGMLMGTPAYMAPEQVQGRTDADARTDVWAIGVMIYELITGRLPFDETESPALFVAIATKDIPPLSQVDRSVPAAVSQLVARCLRRDAAERYPSAKELARDFRAVFAGAELEAPRSGPKFAVPDLAIPKPSQPRLPAGATPEIPEPPPSSGRRGPMIDPSAIELADPTPAPPPPSSRRIAVSQPMELGPPRPAASSGRAGAVSPFVPSGVHLPPATEPTRAASDMSTLVAVGVVILVSICVTAVLVTVAYDPDGWPVLAYVTTPTPMTSLIAHGLLALGALFLAGRLGATGVRRWGVEWGARGSAVFCAVVAGAFLFAALQLGRAAF